MTIRLRITEATLDDAPLVYDIMQAAFAEYLGTLYPPSSAHDETIDDVIHVMNQGGAVLAWEGDRAVGSARYTFEDDHCYIGRVAVLPDQRGRGIASSMMLYIEEIAREHHSPRCEIAVRMVLESNIELYRRLHYEVVEIYVHPRGDGEQRVAVMAKTL